MMMGDYFCESSFSRATSIACVRSLITGVFLATNFSTRSSNERVRRMEIMMRLAELRMGLSLEVIGCNYIVNIVSNRITLCTDQVYTAPGRQRGPGYLLQAQSRRHRLSCRWIPDCPTNRAINIVHCEVGAD